MCKIELCGIVDVGTYNTILDPIVALDNRADDDNVSAAEFVDIEDLRWKNFSFKLYMDKVLELAVLELKKLIAKLPAKHYIKYVEGSAEIDSPKLYNYRNDMLLFKVTAAGRWSAEKLQDYISTTLATDINDEFNATYNIYELLCGDHSVEEFSVDL